MSPTQKKRFTVVAAIVCGVGLATFFALQAFQANIEYFLTPQQVNAGEYQENQLYRIGGLVKTGSVNTLSDGVTKRFDVTDCEHDVTIQYTGILPDLFREGQAIVANGRFDQGNIMIANQVLAKHDENYVPNEAAEAVMLAQANKCNTTEGTVNF
ncbi:MAG: cytochrome c maturation protein CcmE [Acidiferrobacterales bacterium]|nr:cytochrome c maturation protein CcmE [Acidiferrobacterales bacterium]